MRSPVSSSGGTPGGLVALEVAARGRAEVAGVSATAGEYMESPVHCRPMAAPATADEIRDVNTRYHDAAAAEYDAKWGIDFGEIGRAQVLGKLRKALGGRAPGASPARWRSAPGPATSRST